MEIENEKNGEEEDSKKLRPPYPSSGKADLALDIFRRLTPKKIDKQFVIDNNLASPTNAFRILDLYRWLGIIDKKGNTIPEVIGKLRLVGKEKEEFLSGLIRKAYSDLFDAVNIGEANKYDIINFFISNHYFSQIQAKFATSLFLYLCSKHNIPLSKKLAIKIPLIQKTPRKKVPSRIEPGKTKLREHSQVIPKSPTDKGIFIRGGVSVEFDPKTKEEVDDILANKLPEIFTALKTFLPSENELKEGKESN